MEIQLKFSLALAPVSHNFPQYAITLNKNCHNPTNNPKQFKTTFVGVAILSVKNPPPPHHHTGCDYNLGSFRQLRKLIFGMQPYSYPTRINMKDDLNIFSKMEDDLNFLRKTT
jgi:hypothetical protein